MIPKEKNNEESKIQIHSISTLVLPPLRIRSQISDSNPNIAGYCEGCGRIIRTPNSCPYCGNKNSVEKILKNISNILANLGNQYYNSCDKCGTRNHTSNIYCEECGYFLGK